MENYDFKENPFQIFDPIDKYFECITSCDLNDGNCISKCLENLKDNDNLNF